jgi:phosphatidylglycerophosphatase A
MFKKSKKEPLAKQSSSRVNISFLISTICGLGKFPLFPGTIGALVAALEFSFYIQQNIIISYYFIYLLIILPIFIYAIDQYCNSSASKDPKEVIADEYYGQYIAQLFSYVCCMNILVDNLLTYLLIIISFIFFRIFDIAKPWLVGYCDKNIKNAFGVILDDIVAGFMAAISTIIIIYIIYYLAY